MRRNSGIIGTSKSIGTEISAINGMYDSFDAYNYKLVDAWPYTQKYVSHSLSPGTTVSEGSSLTVNVVFTGFLDGELAYYSVNTVSGATMTNADFAQGVTGSFTVTGNVGLLTLSLLAGDGTENNQFNVDIRRGSTSGDIFFTTATISVTDVADIVGQVNYLTPGTFSWTAPGGVTSVCILCIGGGGGGIAYYSYSYGMMGGAGGGLGWKNNYSVTPGNNYTVKVGDNGINGVYSTGSTSGEDSYFISTSVVKGGSGRYGRYGQATPNSSYTGDGGGGGGGSDFLAYSQSGPGGGGGAGGYTGDGGKGRHTTYGTGFGGSGGGAGGNGGSGTTNTVAYSGGGVGIYGQGTDGHNQGGGGSGGTDGTVNGAGVYGGGGGGATNGASSSKPGQSGAVRIIWGLGRSYPNTLTTDQ